MVTIIVVVVSAPLRVSFPGLGAKLVGSLSQRCDGRLGCPFPAYVKPLENNTVVSEVSPTIFAEAQLTGKNTDGPSAAAGLGICSLAYV